MLEKKHVATGLVDRLKKNDYFVIFGILDGSDEGRSYLRRFTIV